MPDMFGNVREFENRLGLPQDFYRDLLNENDWSFIIKISALFEAATTHTLVNKLNTPALEESFSYLDQANSRCGRIRLLKNLDVIYPEQAKILENLATLRNKCAHDISNASFSFEEYIAGKDSNQKKAFVKWAGHGIKDNTALDTTEESVNISRSDFTLENPKLSIWLTAAEVLACMYLEVDFSEAANQFSYQNWITPGTLASG